MMLEQHGCLGAIIMETHTHEPPRDGHQALADLCTDDINSASGMPVTATGAALTPGGIAGGARQVMGQSACVDPH
jgi:hypothetical protein